MRGVSQASMHARACARNKCAYVHTQNGKAKEAKFLLVESAVNQRRFGIWGRYFIFRESNFRKRNHTAAPIRGAGARAQILLRVY